MHQRDGRDLVARVRLRGIDAPEMKASCQDELDKAEAATGALRNLLGQGGVTIYNLGSEKYGRVLADVATKRTANVSAAMLAGGYRAQLQWRSSRRLVRARLALLVTKKPRRNAAFSISVLGLGDQRATTTVVPTETRL